MRKAIQLLEGLKSPFPMSIQRPSPKVNKLGEKKVATVLWLIIQAAMLDNSSDNFWPHHSALIAQAVI